MAGITKINGASYTVRGGKAHVGGTAYQIKKGVSKINGTQHSVVFGDYQLCEYIESDGNSWIDTGILGSDDVGYQLDYMLMGQQDNLDRSLFGESVGYKQGVSDAMRTVQTNMATHWYYVYYIRQYVQLYSRWEINRRDIVRFNYNNSKNFEVEVADTGAILFSQTYGGSSNVKRYNAFLFGWNESKEVYDPGDGNHFLSQMRLYSCKMTDGQTLVRDYRPAYRLSDGAIGLYDAVSRTFFTNQGTGAFTKGADI